MSSDSARSLEDVGTGALCPLEIFNEFQMDIQDPGSGSTPFLQASSQLNPVRAPGPWHPGNLQWEVKRRPNN